MKLPRIPGGSAILQDPRRLAAGVFACTKKGCVEEDREALIRKYLPEGRNYEDLSEEAKQWFWNMLADKYLPAKRRKWEDKARNKQLPPDHPDHHKPTVEPRSGKTYSCSDNNPNCTGANPNWEVWLCLSGRGTGKTMAGSNWILGKALAEPEVWVGVCAPTFADVKNVCFEGESGIIHQAEPGDIIDYNKNGLKITVRNGSVIQGYSAEKKESIRGANLSACWFDELAMIRYREFYEAGLQPALRRGDNPQLMITTTPKRTKLINMLMLSCKAEPERYHLTQAVSEENPYFAAVRLRDLRKRYAGTFLEKQELEGILVEEVDGALFSQETLRDNYVGADEVPEFRQVIVAVDPSTSSEQDSDETGIIVAAEGVDKKGYLLADWSIRGTPKDCMQRAVAAFYHYEAGCIIGERNNVGDYMRETIMTIDPNVPFMPVWAQRGKSIRAQPVSIHAQQGRIKFVGNPGDFDDLELQLCGMSVDSDRSAAHDDRADAFVWAFRWLKGMSEGSYKEAYGFFDCPKCGQQMNEKDKTCRACGRDNPDNTTVRPHHDTRWSGVYINTCHTCKTSYPTHVRKCPKCNLNPESYLKAAMGGEQKTDWKGYRGRRR